MKRIRRKAGASARHEPRPVVAVVWYRNEAAWQKMKQMATDPERFEDSYGAWVKMFEESIKNFESGGVLPLKVALEPSEYASWCTSNGQPFGASSRSQYAAHMLRESVQD